MFDTGNETKLYIDPTSVMNGAIIGESALSIPSYCLEYSKEGYLTIVNVRLFDFTDSRYIIIPAFSEIN